ncbi:MAG: biotin--[acetyl-CoA-carboxylase] ligase [Rikenellaceae bacterium]|nr:biotin--[acetyl-CoA-carboxylase] ligase [Rikenellaceae bacterium]
MIYHFEEVTSTNDIAREAKYRHGDIVCAERQTAGRGQRGHTWVSPEGKNLTFTLVAEPRFLAAAEQFALLQVAALSLVDTFARFGIETRIKWTNDIYHNDQKLVGILIEHFYAGAKLNRTLIGIGINVNQEAFDPTLPNPVSMYQIAGKQFDRKEVLATFEECFAARFLQLEKGVHTALQKAYHEALYRRGRLQLFRLPDGEEFQATILGVEPQGELRLQDAEGKISAYRFKEVEFVVKK